MIRASILIVLLVVLVPDKALAEPASDAQMASEALIPYVPNDPAKRDQILNKQRQEILSLAQHTPDEVRPATVFFGAGLSAAELQGLRNDFGVEVIDVMVKAPQGADGTIMSIQVGMADLFAVEGSLEDRLSFVSSAEQRCFAKLAEHMPPDEVPEWTDLATRPFFVYWARIFGPASSLRDLQQQPSVTGVMLNVGPDVISDFEAARSYDGPHRYLMPGFHC